MRSASVRTFHADEFSPADLVDAKGTTTVSLCLPARNEASTVGLIVDEVRHALIDSIPLVDEILVVDDHSSDDTAAVARAAGARVVDAVRRAGRLRRGPRQGRGALEVAPRGPRRRHRVGRRRHPRVRRQVRRRPARPPAARSDGRLRQGLLRAAGARRHRRRSGHRARRPPAAVDVLPRAHLGVPAARRRVRRSPFGARAAAVRRRLRRRRRAPDRHRPPLRRRAHRAGRSRRPPPPRTARSPSWDPSPTR